MHLAQFGLGKTAHPSGAGDPFAQLAIDFVCDRDDVRKPRFSPARRDKPFSIQ